MNELHGLLPSLRIQRHEVGVVSRKMGMAVGTPDSNRVWRVVGRITIYLTLAGIVIKVIKKVPDRV